MGSRFRLRRRTSWLRSRESDEPSCGGRTSTESAAAGGKKRSRKSAALALRRSWVRIPFGPPSPSTANCDATLG